MAHRLRSAVFVLGCAAARALGAAAPLTVDDGPLIEAARRGDYGPALERLSELRREGRASPQQMADLALIAHWAGRDREAVEAYREIRQPPDWLLLPIAQAALALDDAGTACEVAQRAADTGDARYERAGVLAQCLVAEGRADEAFAMLDKVLREPATAASASAIARLQHERQALAIRHAEALQGGAPRVRVTAAQGLALRLNTEALQADAAFPDLARATRYDRLLALRDHQAMEAVLAQWQDMPEAARRDAPAYARVAIADALLGLHRPRDAQAMYEAAIAQQKREAPAQAIPLAWRTGLYYALLEGEQPRAARREVESMRADASSSSDAGLRLRVRLLAALDHLYADELDAAQDELGQLRAEAGGNAGVRAAWVRLLRAREQPRAAYEEARRLEADAPYAQADVLLAGLSLDRQRWKEARERLGLLLREAPTDSGVQREADALERHDTWTLRLETVITHTHGPDPREPSFLAQLYAPPIDENWRPFAFESSIPANAREGAGPRHRIGAGLEWRDGDWTASADVNHDNAGVKREGMDLRIARALSDHHAVAAEYESNTRDLSLRAFVNNIYADAFGARYVYSANESRKLLATVRETRFSDGNRRTETGVEWRERVFSDARHRVDASLAAGRSRNSEEGRPYFNPPWDASVQLGLAFERLEWREYARSFRQRVAGGYGLYRQPGFATRPYGELRYGHEWDARDAWNLAYGVGYAMHPYDGRQERAPFAFLAFSWYPR